MEHGHPTSYLAVSRGTPVYSTDGAEIGRVRRVLAVHEKHIFDGIVIRTAAGDRFLDAPEVDRLYERAVTTTLTEEEARALPEARSALTTRASHAAQRTWRRVVPR